MVFFSCVDRVGQQAAPGGRLVLPDLAVINSELPLKLPDLDLPDTQKTVHLNDGIEAEIRKTIYSYYFIDCSGDSSETYFKVKDTYIGTIRLHDSLQTIFMVLFKHLPAGEVNSKLIFYNNSTKEFIGHPIDFNLHALYDFNNGKLAPSNLKDSFKITTPEIELVDFDKDGINEFRLTRLYHNGTANTIETIVLKICNNNVDTVEFKQKWIGAGT